MKVVPLGRFKLEGFLDSGADYEAHAVTDTHTGKQVVIKRPNPDYISRRLHHGVDRLSRQLIQVHKTIAHSIPYVAHLVGYTRLARHNGYFGDDLTERYRVLVEERARGVPLMADIRDKFKGVPVGLGQNLFALHPLIPHSRAGRFPIHQQLIDVEEAFHDAGHLLLDMRPQNVFFDPEEGRITVIDLGTIPTKGKATQGMVSMGNRPQDIHDFFAEMFKFYTTADHPPSRVDEYGEAAGMRSLPGFDEQLDQMIEAFSATEDAAVREAAVTALQRIRRRAYSSFREFREDFSRYLACVERRNESLPALASLRGVWGRALQSLSDGYWRKFLFDPGRDLASYRTGK